MDWDRANQMNVEQMELLMADTAADLEEDRSTLAELRNGGDLRALFERWMEGSIRKREGTLRDMQAHVARYKAVLAEHAAEKGGP